MSTLFGKKFFCPGFSAVRSRLFLWEQAAGGLCPLFRGYFLSFLALAEPGPRSLPTSLKERLNRSACLFKSVLSLVA